MKLVQALLSVSCLVSCIHLENGDRVWCSLGLVSGAVFIYLISNEHMRLLTAS
jgi:hypothetical protein